MTLEEAILSIKPLDKIKEQNAQNRWNSIAKPLHSLGLLEDYIIKLSAISETDKPCLDKKALVIMCADNGVVEEGVTQTGKEVTAIVANNFTTGNTSVCCMAECTGVDIFPIDIGIDANIENPQIIHKKIAYGTENITKKPAMTRQMAVQAIETGIEAVGILKEKGYNIIATGEMGIGNTTTSSAITAVLLNIEPEIVTGKGAGLSNDGLENKINTIKKAIKINKPDFNNPLDVLSKLGGYDIAGLVGVFIGGAVYNIPVVIDGFISAVAALLAFRLSYLTRDYMLASHISKEPAMKYVLDKIGLEPAITCNMCLGEGTGAVSLFPLLDMALNVYNKMSTFNQINIEEYKQL